MRGSHILSLVKRIVSHAGGGPASLPPPELLALPLVPPAPPVWPWVPQAERPRPMVPIADKANKANPKRCARILSFILSSSTVDVSWDTADGMGMARRGGPAIRIHHAGDRVT